MDRENIFPPPLACTSQPTQLLNLALVAPARQDAPESDPAIIRVQSRFLVGDTRHRVADLTVNDLMQPLDEVVRIVTARLASQTDSALAETSGLVPMAEVTIYADEGGVRAVSETIARMWSMSQ